MNKFSTKQLPEMLFLHAFKIADMVANEKEIFPETQTMDDHEKLIHYALMLFKTHDNANGKNLNEDAFYETIVYFYRQMIERGIFAEDDAIARAKKSDASINEFLYSHLKFLKHRDDADSLIQYTSEIFSQIPSCKDLGAFSIAGVTFARLLPQLIDTVAQAYDDLIDAWEKSPEDDPMNNFIVETYPPAEKPSPSPAGKKPLALIICAIALICSLIGNIYLVSRNEPEPTVEKTYWEDAYRDLYLTCSQLADEVDGLKEEYLFYHQYAVIISENNDYYHRYGCNTIGDGTFWIHNIDYAKYLGHWACPECNPDNHGSLVIRNTLETLIDDAPSKPIGPEEAPNID